MISNLQHAHLQLSNNLMRKQVRKYFRRRIEAVNVSDNIMIQTTVVLLFIAGYAASELEANDVRVRNERGNSEEETRVDDIVHILQGSCERENSEQAIKQLKIDTQEILNNIGIYKEVVKMNKKLRSEIKWILDESNGSRERSRMISLLKKGVKDMCKPKPKFHPRDCTELKKVHSKSGAYMIYPDKVNGVKAYCDMDTDGGGWTVIQRRTDRTVKFERKWTEYEKGFGDVKGEHWLGNTFIHILTTSAKYELRVDLETIKGQKTYAIYKTFTLGDAASQYQLTVHNYSGTAGNYLESRSSAKFSTRDRDNDGESGNLADGHGPWWYKGGSSTWLLADQRENYWGKAIGRKTSMMIRRVKR